MTAPCPPPPPLRTPAPQARLRTPAPQAPLRTPASQARLHLVRPTAAHLPSYVAALERGFSPDHIRGAVAAVEQLQQIAHDPAAFLALMDDPEAKGPPVTLPDGTTRARIPSLRRWMWLGAQARSAAGANEATDEATDGANDEAASQPAGAMADAAAGERAGQTAGEFVGSIGLRWTADGSPLPPHVLGHIGYAVAPWHQRRGHATGALALMLRLARERGLLEVEITTDPDNRASQRVIEANGGVLRERFDKGEAYAHAVGLRYVIGLLPAGPPASAG